MGDIHLGLAFVILAINSKAVLISHMGKVLFFWSVDSLRIHLHVFPSI